MNAIPKYTLIIGWLLTSCQSQPTDNDQKTTEVQETEQSWIYLFDGTSLDGWRGFNSDVLPPNWIIEDSTLKALGTGGDIGGDLIYGKEMFENFELQWEWKISEGGNSGLFYHGVEGDQYNAIYDNAPEYQLIDDNGFPAPLEEWQKVGADYAMYFNSDKPVRPAGEWNTSGIIFTPDKVEYWLNGQMLFTFVPWSEDWLKRKREGKWKDYPDYGMAKTGYIGLQDHGDVAWFRNIRIKRI
jgi:hypothetical protein